MDINQLSTSTQKVYDLAVRAAWDFQSGYLGSEHFFIGLLSAGGLDINRAFVQAKLDPRRIERVLRVWLRNDIQRVDDENLSLSPRSEKVFRSASLKAARAGQLVEPVHLLQAILEDQRSVPTKVLNQIRLRKEQSASQRLLKQVERIMELRRSHAEQEQDTHSLHQFAIQLCGSKSVAYKSTYENLACELINCRRPLIVGEKGIGKLSVVNGFIDWLQGDQAPNELRQIKFFQVTEVSLRVGIREGVEASEQLEEFFAQAWQDDDVVLVLDNLPSLLEESYGFSRQIATVVRQVIDNGTLRCIALANNGGYRRIENTESIALRKFVPVTVSEINSTQVQTVLTTSSVDLEEFHDVKIKEAAIDAAVDLSIRFLPEFRLPGKAVDLLDQACAWDLLVGLRPKEKVDEETSISFLENTITVDKVVKAAARMSGVSAAKIAQSKEELVADIYTALEERIAGQEMAIEQIAETFQQTSRQSQVNAALVFHGPPGVGKSEAAKTITAQLCGRSTLMLQLDLSDFVGDRGMDELFALTTRRGVQREGIVCAYLRQSPCGVICMDGLDSAEPKVLDKLAEIIRTGCLRIDDENSFSALETSFLFTCLSTGPGANIAWKSQQLSCAVDAVVAFDYLTDSELADLLSLRIQKVRHELASYGLELELGEEVLENLVRESGEGARALERHLNNMVVDPVSSQLAQRDPEASRVVIHSHPENPGETTVKLI